MEEKQTRACYVIENIKVLQYSNEAHDKYKMVFIYVDFIFTLVRMAVRTKHRWRQRSHTRVHYMGQQVVLLAWVK